jgi:hypothetical protein
MCFCVERPTVSAGAVRLRGVDAEGADDLYPAQRSLLRDRERDRRFTAPSRFLCFARLSRWRQLRIF